jgi:hypothetical protein
MRRIVVLPLSLLLAAAPLLLAPSSATSAPSIRGTPQQTLARFKSAFARGDHGAEWETLSPGFKLRLNKRAGRNVDVGDYITARNAHRKDPRIRELTEWMHTANITELRYDSKGRAVTTIRFGAPLLLGKDVTVTMVNHEHWELWIKGEKQPYWGFMGSRNIEVFQNPKTGVHTVRTKDARGKVTWQKQFPRAKVHAYRTLTRWYFDNFGQYEEQLMRNAARRRAPAPTRVPPPAPRKR